MPDFVSPNTGNYQIAKAEVYFTPKGADPVTGRRHVGNVPEATFAVEVEKLDHFSSMAGIRKKDFSATLGVTATLTLNLEEMTEDNLKLALLGGASEDNTDGENTFNIGEVESTTGRVEVIGTNDVGPKWSYDFHEVTLTPSDAVSFIGDEYSALVLEGDVLAIAVGDITRFGTATLQGSTTA
jgi:hypothetical protein